MKMSNTDEGQGRVEHRWKSWTKLGARVSNRKEVFDGEKLESDDNCNCIEKRILKRTEEE